MISTLQTHFKQYVKCNFKSTLFFWYLIKVIKEYDNESETFAGEWHPHEQFQITHVMVLFKIFLKKSYLKCIF